MRRGQTITTGREYTRRQVLGGGAAGLGAIFIAACGSSGKLPGKLAAYSGPVAAGIPGPPAAGGLHGRSIAVAWTAQPNSLDPALGYDLPSWDSLCCLTTAPLMTFIPGSATPAPNAAASVPQVSDGGRTYTIKLRPGVRFHHGRAVTAADYKYSWERVLDPKLASWASSYLSSIEGASAMSAHKSKTLSGVEVVDPMTLRVRLSAPDITFPNILAEPYTAAVPREVVQRYGASFAQHVVSTGPFMLSSYNSTDQTATFSRNPHYFWKGLPYLDTVTYRWGIDAEAQLLQLQEGAIESLGDGVGASLVPEVNAESSLKKFVAIFDTPAVRWLAFNLARKPFHDVRVRQALNWAIDRPAVLLALYGAAQPWGLPFPKTLPGYHRIATPYTYQPAKARALLAAAGAHGLSFTLTITSDDPWPSISQIIQQQLQAVGVTMHIQTVSTSAWSSLTEAKNFDAYNSEWYQVQPTALDILGSNYVTGASSNYYNYSDPKVDSLANQATRTRDHATSNELLARAEKLIAADAPGLFLSTINFVDGRAPSLRNFHYNLYYGTYYDRLWTA